MLHLSLSGGCLRGSSGGSCVWKTGQYGQTCVEKCTPAKMRSGKHDCRRWPGWRLPLLGWTRQGEDMPIPCIRQNVCGKRRLPRDVPMPGLWPPYGGGENGKRRRNVPPAFRSDGIEKRGCLLAEIGEKRLQRFLLLLELANSPITLIIERQFPGPERDP